MVIETVFLLIVAMMGTWGENSIMLPNLPGLTEHRFTLLLSGLDYWPGPLDHLYVHSHSN